MASVFAARHLRLGHLVAIKILHPQYQKNPEVASRFLEEARIQANLRHPNILTVQDILELADYSGMVMELLDGATLSGYYRKVGLPLDVPRVLGLFLPLVDALVYAHECDVVHRDLKPANVFLHCGKQEVVPKLMDFGIAKVRNTAMQTNLTAAGAVLGTPQYMAPEQFEDSSKVDFRADIYAMGVMLYEALAGRLPFTGSTPGAIMKEVLLSPLTPPKELVPGLDSELDALVVKCLDRNRDRRFSSAVELYKALETLGFRLGRKVPAVTEVERVDLRAKGIDIPSSRTTPLDDARSHPGVTLGEPVVAGTKPLPTASQEKARPTLPESPASRGSSGKLPLTLETHPAGTDWRPTASVPAPKKSKAGWIIGGVILVIVAAAGGLILSNGRSNEPADTSSAKSPAAQVASQTPPATPNETAAPSTQSKEAVTLPVQGEPPVELHVAKEGDVAAHAADAKSGSGDESHKPQTDSTALAPLPAVSGLVLGTECPAGPDGVRNEVQRAVNGLMQAGWRGQTLAMMGSAAWKEMGLVAGDVQRAQALRQKTGVAAHDAMAAWLEETAKPFLVSPLDATQLQALATRLANPDIAAFAKAKARFLCETARAAELDDKAQDQLFAKVLQEAGMQREQFHKVNDGPDFDSLLRAEVAARAICCLVSSGTVQ